MSTTCPPTDQRDRDTSAADRRAWWGLAVLTLPVLLVSMDFSVLYLAIPSITVALDPSAAEQLWILDIYGFLIAGLLITMGNVGDRIGRRRILLAGAAVFGIASVIAAFAPSAEVLIAARALMGIGGATLMPSSLSLIANMFTDGRNRARAIGVWTAAFAGGSAIGPVIGGILLHHFWWGAVFLINVPVLAVLFVLGPRLVPEYRADGPHAPFDVTGVVLSMLAILPIMYAIKTAASEGFSPVIIASATIGVLALVGFILQQRAARAPLLDLSLFGSGRFVMAILVALLGMMTLGGTSYLTGVYLQSVLGHDVLVAAFAGLPMAITVAVFSIGTGRVVARFGERASLSGAVALSAIGLAGLQFLTTDSPLWIYIVSTAVAGVGFAVQFSLVSEIVVGSVPPERSGAASGISETSFELGTASGLAVLGSIATLVFHASGAGLGFGDTLGETLQTASGMGPDGVALADAARAAYVDGLHAAMALAVIALGVLSVVVAVVMRERPAVVEQVVETGRVTEAH
ncbi:MFS transporter [Gordonia sp. NB41Y]|uniref:MFS transporter n=1 Tax=Gordonia sp. NB41Y TaxID=875808 RepID=UPI0002BEE173|nr:MFS transporter [Gordonia sp. NB41Y]EMP10743.1 permease [Gordonia sp. NB41Y]WLP92596.1 MFS transporter [Gordonia sp. NB41Y]